MRKFAAFIIICALAMAARGQEQADTAVVMSIVERINASPAMRVEQPEALNARLQSAPAEHEEEAGMRRDSGTAGQQRVGYRIQVFDDNNPRTARNEAQERKRLMESRFPEWRSYVQFNSPYWRVKVGDFRSRSEAEAAIEDMRRAFPYMSAQLRLVRDHINAEQ